MNHGKVRVDIFVADALPGMAIPEVQRLFIQAGAKRTFLVFNQNALAVMYTGKAVVCGVNKENLDDAAEIGLMRQQVFDWPCCMGPLNLHIPSNECDITAYLPDKETARNRHIFMYTSKSLDMASDVYTYFAARTIAKPINSALLQKVVGDWFDCCSGDDELRAAVVGVSREIESCQIGFRIKISSEATKIYRLWLELYFRLRAEPAIKRNLESVLFSN